MKALIFILIVLLFWGMVHPLYVHAVMPPEVYIGQQKSASIHAIAVVEAIAIKEKGTYSDYLQVTFRIEKLFSQVEGFVDTNPKMVQELAKINKNGTFTGYCEQVRLGCCPPPGGTIYRYPVVQQRVFVSVNGDFGEIEGMTTMTKELDEALKKGLAGIEFNMTGISPIKIEEKEDIILK